MHRQRSRSMFVNTTICMAILACLGTSSFQLRDEQLDKSSRWVEKSNDPVNGIALLVTQEVAIQNRSVRPSLAIADCSMFSNEEIRKFERAVSDAQDDLVGRKSPDLSELNQWIYSEGLAPSSVAAIVKRTSDSSLGGAVRGSAPAEVAIESEVQTENVDMFIGQITRIVALSNQADECMKKSACLAMGGMEVTDGQEQPVAIYVKRVKYGVAARSEVATWSVGAGGKGKEPSGTVGVTVKIDLSNAATATHIIGCLREDGLGNFNTSDYAQAISDGDATKVITGLRAATNCDAVVGYELKSVSLQDCEE